MDDSDPLPQPAIPTAAILVIGAGGFIGRAVVARLAAAGLTVWCCGRDAERLRRLFPGRPVLAGDLAHDGEAEWRERLAGIGTVVNAAGLIRDSRGGTLAQVHAEGPARLFQACRAAGVRRVVQISAIGADAGATTRYHRTKQAAEQALSATGLDACVIRPSLVVGRGGGSTSLFGALAALPLRPRLGGGAVQPIHLDDLTEAIVRLCLSTTPLPPRLDAVGPQVMSIDDLIAVVGTWLDLPPRPAVPLPGLLLRAAGRCGDLVGTGAVTSDSLAMLRRGNTGDAGPLTALLGRSPRPVGEALATTPATQADRWHARLLPIRPVLRLTLAVLWLVTAAVSFGLYPLDDSRALLAAVGLTGPSADLALFGAAALDGGLGAALLVGWRPVLVGALQLAAMAAFSLIAIALPAEYWLHPFAPLVKTLPIAAATLVMMALEA